MKEIFDKRRHQRNRVGKFRVEEICSNSFSLSVELLQNEVLRAQNRGMLVSTGFLCARNNVHVKLPSKFGSAIIMN